VEGLFSEKGFRKSRSRWKKEEKIGKNRNFEENVGMLEGIVQLKRR